MSNVFTRNTEKKERQCDAEIPLPGHFSFLRAYVVSVGPFRPSKFSNSRKFENISSHVHTHDGKWERIRIKKGLKKTANKQKTS